MDAIDDLGDAVGASRAFLTPVRAGTWLKLAAVVVFVSSLGFGLETAIPGSDTLLFTDDPTGGGWQFEGVEEPEGTEGQIPTEQIESVLLALAGLFLLVWLCYAFVAGIMEFVFLESLRSREVRLRRHVAANLRKGSRLFLFRLGLLLFVGALGAAPGYFVAAGEGSLSDLSPGLFGLYTLYGGLVYVGYSIVRRFTDEFVAPIMLLEDRSVVDAWGRFREPLTENWTEYAVYLLVTWILTLAVTIAAWTVVGIGLFVLTIPITIVVFVLVLLGPIGLLLLFVVGPLLLAVVLLFMGLVWAPITTFFQYYALLLLGDTDDDLDLIPDQRAAIRAPDDTVGFGRTDDWTGTKRGQTRRDDRGADERASWERSDPWTDAEGSDTDPRSGVTDSDDADPWSEDTDGDGSDPWTEANDGDDVDPWDEGTDSEVDDPWGETDDDIDRDGDGGAVDDGDDDERTW